MNTYGGDNDEKENTQRWDKKIIQFNFSLLQVLGKLIQREKKPLLVLFYAPWCGFCKKMKPDYLEAAQELKGVGNLAAVDVTKPANSVVRDAFNITGFPTIIYFQ